MYDIPLHTISTLRIFTKYAICTRNLHHQHFLPTLSNCDTRHSLHQHSLLTESVFLVGYRALCINS